MNCLLKIARSPKTNKVYSCFELEFTKVFIDIEDAVKLTGISFAELQYVTVDKPFKYEIDIQGLSE